MDREIKSRLRKAFSSLTDSPSVMKWMEDNVDAAEIPIEVLETPECVEALKEELTLQCHKAMCLFDPNNPSPPEAVELVERKLEEEDNSFGYHTRWVFMKEREFTASPGALFDVEWGQLAVDKEIAEEHVGRWINLNTKVKRLWGEVVVVGISCFHQELYRKLFQIPDYAALLRPFHVRGSVHLPEKAEREITFREGRQPQILVALPALQIPPTGADIELGAPNWEDQAHKARGLLDRMYKRCRAAEIDLEAYVLSIKNRTTEAEARLIIQKQEDKKRADMRRRAGEH